MNVRTWEIDFLPQKWDEAGYILVFLLWNISIYWRQCDSYKKVCQIKSITTPVKLDFSFFVRPWDFRKFSIITFKRQFMCFKTIKNLHNKCLQQSKAPQICIDCFYTSTFGYFSKCPDMRFQNFLMITFKRQFKCFKTIKKPSQQVSAII